MRSSSRWWTCCPRRWRTCTAANACPTVSLTPQTVQGGVHQGTRRVRGHGVVVPRADDRISTSRALFAPADVPGLGAAARPVVGARTSGRSRRASARWRSTRRRCGGAAREALDQLEREDRLGIVLLGRPYHHDPGAESRHPGGAAEARLSGVLAEHAAARRGPAGSALRRGGPRGRHRGPARHRRRVEELVLRRAPTTRSGRPSSRRGTPTSSRSRCPTSSAATMRRSTR